MVPPEKGAWVILPKIDAFCHPGGVTSYRDGEGSQGGREFFKLTYPTLPDESGFTKGRGIELPPFPNWEGAGVRSNPPLTPPLIRAQYTTLFFKGGFAPVILERSEESQGGVGSPHTPDPSLCSG